MQDERWEYRIWPESREAISERIMAVLGEEAEAEYRTDVYYLTPAEEFLAKLRDGDIFEVKRLCEQREGFELWRKDVAVKAPRQHDLRALLGEGPQTETGRRFLQSADKGLQTVEVRKHRRLFRLGDAELGATAVVVGERRFDAFALEAPKLDECRRLAEELNFTRLENRDYGRMLRALAPLSGSPADD